MLASKLSTFELLAFEVVPECGFGPRAIIAQVFPVFFQVFEIVDVAASVHEVGDKLRNVRVFW